MNADALAASTPMQNLELFPDPLAHAIVELHLWVLHEGLRGAKAGDLFDGFCQRLVINGVRLFRGYVSTQTLHPQWRGYGYTWQRRMNSVHAQQYERRGEASEIWKSSPFFHLITRAHDGEPTPMLRRRLELGAEQRDFPALVDFHEDGATDYLAMLFTFGENGDPAHGTGVVFSFTTDLSGGFDERSVNLITAALPGLALAIKAHAGHDIASSLLRTYLGEDAGRRVHAGAVDRGTTDGLHAVLWYADIRGFTTASDQWPGPAIIDMLDDVFEALAAPLRLRGGQVLKFIGDAMLAIFAFEDADEAATCRRALDAAGEAMQALASRNTERSAAGLPVVGVDLALHVGEVLYGNVGAADRLDFTVIGPAVNEVSRIEKLCDALGREVLVSERFARAAGDCDGRLTPLGRFALRGVADTKALFGLTAETPRTIEI